MPSLEDKIDVLLQQSAWLTANSPAACASEARSLQESARELDSASLALRAATIDKWQGVGGGFLASIGGGFCILLAPTGPVGIGACLVAAFGGGAVGGAAAASGEINQDLAERQIDTALDKMASASKALCRCIMRNH